MTQGVVAGSVRRAVIILAIPVLGEQLLNTAVGIVDTFLAGQISVTATSAVGLSAYVAWLVSMLFMLVGTGTTALVARHTGANERKTANQIANQSVGLAVGMGFVACGLICVLAPTFASLQKMSGSTADIVTRYLRLDAIGHVFTSVTLIGSAALRGVGDMRTPLKVLSIVNGVNVIVSVTLARGFGPIPSLGVDGIVAGTVVGRLIGGYLTFTILRAGRSGLRLYLHGLRPSLEPARRILRIGFPAAIDGAVMWSGQFVYLIVIASLATGELGGAYYAAHIIGIRIEALTYLPAVAWGTATATIVGQSLGAGDAKRALRAGHEAVLQCGILALGLTAFYYFAADFIYELMHKDTLVRNVGPPAMRLLAFFQVCLTTSIIYVWALRGAGDTRFPLLVTIVSVCLFRLPIGYILGVYLNMGLIGAWIGMCADLVIRAVLATWRYAGAKWTLTTV